MVKAAVYKELKCNCKILVDQWLVDNVLQRKVECTLFKNQRIELRGLTNSIRVSFAHSSP